MSEVRKKPCASCPYRTDVLSGIWSYETYELLRPYDNPTAEQPWEAFGCHATPEKLCHGWAVVHTNRGHEFDLLSLRFLGGVEIPPAKIPLFASGSEAADHGQRDIENPSPRAKAAAKQLRRYKRLREANP